MRFQETIQVMCDGHVARVQDLTITVSKKKLTDAIGATHLYNVITLEPFSLPKLEKPITSLVMPLDWSTPTENYDLRLSGSLCVIGLETGSTRVHKYCQMKAWIRTENVIAQTCSLVIEFKTPLLTAGISFKVYGDFELNPAQLSWVDKVVTPPVLA